MDQKPGKREAKRAALKQKLIQAANERIETGGLANLRARDVTADAGCALGALYNVFEDIDMLILHVNSQTLTLLDEALSPISSSETQTDEQLVALAQGYLGFACDNYNLWSALFEHRMPNGVAVPDWHLKEHSVLFEHISVPVQKMMPHASAEEIQALSKALFAAVHGIVALSLQERFIAVPRAELDDQLKQFVMALVKGLQ